MSKVCTSHRHDNTIYEVFSGILALISVVFVFLDLGSVISLSDMPFLLMDRGILIFFWMDYIYGFAKSESKKEYFKKNFILLIAILPMTELFSLLRIARIFRIARVTRMSRLIRGLRVFRAFSFVSVLRNRMKRFFETNGLIYMVYAAIFLILASAAIMSFFENRPFQDALWWSIVTCTTVGYGDISPVSGIGRIVAVILMIMGIGLIGMLTSAITSFFASPKQEKMDTDIDINLLTEEERILIKKYRQLNNVCKNNITQNVDFLLNKWS